MFSSDSSFSWLLLYQHLALSSCSAQFILESFSGKKRPKPPQDLDFGSRQRFFLYFFPKSLTFSFFLREQKCSLKEFVIPGSGTIWLRRFSCQYFLSGLRVWACASQAVLGVVFGCGCVCTVLQSYYYSSFKQMQGSLKQINLGSSRRAAAGLRFHWLNVQPELVSLCCMLMVLWLWVTSGTCFRGRSGGSFRAAVISGLSLKIVFPLCCFLNQYISIAYQELKVERADLQDRSSVCAYKGQKMGFCFPLLVASISQPGKVPPVGICPQIPHIEVSHSELIKTLGLVRICPSKGSQELQEPVSVAVIFLS